MVKCINYIKYKNIKMIFNNYCCLKIYLERKIFNFEVNFQFLQYSIHIN